MRKTPSGSYNKKMSGRLPLDIHPEAAVSAMRIEAPKTAGFDLKPGKIRETAAGFREKQHIEPLAKLG